MESATQRKPRVGDFFEVGPFCDPLVVEWHLAGKIGIVTKVTGSKATVKYPFPVGEYDVHKSQWLHCRTEENPVYIAQRQAVIEKENAEFVSLVAEVFGMA